MAVTMPCYRHRRGSWIANCSDCTEWHLAAARARRDNESDSSATPSGVLRRLPAPWGETCWQVSLPAAS